MKYFKQKFIFYLLFFAYFTVGAQNKQKMDSISTVLRNTPNKLDTNYIKKLNNHAFNYRAISVDSLTAISQRALDLAEKINYTAEMSSAYINMGIASRLKGESEKAIEFYKKALEISQANNNTKGIISANINMGTVYAQTERFPEAISFYNKATELAEASNDFYKLSSIYGNLGTIYTSQGNLSESLKYHLKGLKIREKIGAKTLIINSLFGIANVYKVQERYDEALQYLDKAFAKSDSTDNKFSMKDILELYSQIHFAKNEPEKALAASFKALQLVKSQNEVLSLPNIFTSIGQLYIQKKEYKKALIYLDSAVLLMQKDKLLANGGYGTYNAIARCYLQSNNVDKALIFAKNSLELAKNSERKEGIREGHLLLFDIYKSQKNYKEALFHYEGYKAYEDSVNNIEIERKNAMSMAQYEFDKKEEILKTKQQQQNEIYEAKSKQKNIILGFSGFVLLLMLVVIIVVYRSRKKIQLANEEIKQKNEEISTQAEQLLETNTVKDKLFSVISHDLRSPLGSLQNSLELLEDQTFSPKEFTDVSQNISQSLKGLLFMLENLLQWSYSQIKGDYLRKENFNLTELLQMNQVLFANVCKFKNIDLQLKNTNKIWVYGEKNQVDLVVRNLINNAIKFTNNGGSISVSCVLQSSEVVVSVTDNGIGIALEKINTIFNPTVMDVEVGTANEKGTGLGLFLCKEMVERNSGKIWVESTLGVGTTFYFSVPLAQN